MYDTVITSCRRSRGKLRPCRLEQQAASALPTCNDAGGRYRGFDISQWQGFLARPARPRPIVERLNAEM